MTMVNRQNFTFEDFEQILNSFLFVEERKALIERLIRYPERFTGLFRPSTPSEKILQNIIQSREIKFGDAFEKIIDQILNKSGYTPLQKRLGSKLKCDHLFESPDGRCRLLIEQKMRDDHDSTKREGQFNNFVEKIRYVSSELKDGQRLYAIMYFVDPDQKKNENYYRDRSKQFMEQIKQEENISILILYGEELFNFIHENISSICINWDTLISWLQQWKKRLSSRQVTQVNWETEDIISEMKELAQKRPELFSKLASQKILWKEGVIQALFPTGSGLEAVCEELERNSRNYRKRNSRNSRSRKATVGRKAAKQLRESIKAAEQLRESIRKYYGNSEESR
jgi:hypothetical protein